MEVIIIDVSPDGVMRCIVNEHTASLLAQGDVQINRASHVEPVNPVLRSVFRLIRRRVSDNSRLAAFTRTWWCRWQADMALSGGPVLGPFTERSEALLAEQKWINQRLLGSEADHEL